ncbi:MAG: ATP-binding cassette domain-containing protein [Neisseriaceae bacterium]
MKVINAENMELALGHHDLLHKACFSLLSQEKVGLIGRNGTGKSSFLRVLAGKLNLDNGTVQIQRGTRITYVSQLPELNPDSTISEIVAEGLGKAQALINAYHQQSSILAKDPSNLEILKNLHQLQLELETQHGWALESLIQEALEHTRIPPSQFIRNLSGGQKKQVQLAQAWIQKPDLLLLDEPTNHLDIDSIYWLENLLLKFKGSLIVVTHDRQFLDNVVDRIVELDRGLLISYPGNFQYYQAKKKLALETEIKHQRQFDKFHAQEEAWIRKGIEARRTRNEGRVKRLEALRKERQSRREVVGNVAFSSNSAPKSGKLVIEFNEVSFYYPNQSPIIERYSGIVQRGDKIGLVGPNGCGKTTFIKLILGELEPKAGFIKRGSLQKIAYVDQFRSSLRDSDTLFEAIGEGKENLVVNGKERHVIGYLQDFLFPPARINSPVASLSGGEKNRLLLAKLFTQPANILILDEPTNDLDIETQELLEQLLKTFSGTVFLVSHDRTFLNNVITQTIGFEGNGQLINYVGNYQNYRLKQQKNLAPSLSNNKFSKLPFHPRTPSKQTITFKEKQELASLPQEIEKLEREQNTLNLQLLQPEIFKTQPLEARQWQKRTEEIELLLTEKLSRWDFLEKKQDNKKER